MAKVCRLTLGSTKSRTRTLLALLILGVQVLASTCQAQFGQRVKDYNFTVSGAVITEDDARIQDADVTLELNVPVYNGVTPLKAIHVKTTASGAFVFAYLSHQQEVKYTLSVHKTGFESVVINGSCPPPGKHVIRLKRTDN